MRGLVRRLFWLTTGAAAGFGGSVWMLVKVRDRMARYRPDRVATDVTHAVRDLRHDVRTAVAEGRKAMRRREAALRAELAPRSPTDRR